MILTVALNATVNVTYEADEIAWGASNHLSRMTCRAGGGAWRWPGCWPVSARTCWSRASPAGEPGT